METSHLPTNETSDEQRYAIEKHVISSSASASVVQDHFHLRERLFIDSGVLESSFEVTAFIAKINIEGVWSVRAKTIHSRSISCFFDNLLVCSSYYSCLIIARQTYMVINTQLLSTVNQVCKLLMLPLR